MIKDDYYLFTYLDNAQHCSEMPRFPRGLSSRKRLNNNNIIINNITLHYSIRTKKIKNYHKYLSYGTYVIRDDDFGTSRFWQRTSLSRAVRGGGKGYWHVWEPVRDCCSRRGVERALDGGVHDDDDDAAAVAVKLPTNHPYCRPPTRPPTHPPPPNGRQARA